MWNRWSSSPIWNSVVVVVVKILKSQILPKAFKSIYPVYPRRLLKARIIILLPCLSQEAFQLDWNSSGNWDSKKPQYPRRVIEERLSIKLEESKAEDSMGLQNADLSTWLEILVIIWIKILCHSDTLVTLFLFLYFNFTVVCKSKHLEILNWYLRLAGNYVVSQLDLGEEAAFGYR